MRSTRSNRSARLAAALAALLGAGGCVRHQTPIVSTTALGAYEWPLGPAVGASRATYIFGLGPIGDDSVGAAVARAIGRDADALLNMTVDRQTTYIPAPFFPIVTRVETRVVGTAVVYVDDEGAEIFSHGSEHARLPVEPARYSAPSPAAATPAPSIPSFLGDREDMTDSDFRAFFQGLRRGAAVDLVLQTGERISGNFGRIGLDGQTVSLGTGMLGSQEVAIDRIAELRSRTIRGEVVQLKRG